MIRQLVKRKRKHILLDIGTQKDFFLAHGNACINGHRKALRNIRRMMAWARSNRVTVISTCEVYAKNNNGGSTAGYCVDGTDGQKKIRYTVVPDRVVFAADGSNDLPEDLVCRHRQIILNSRCSDPFDEPRIERLLSEVAADEFIVIGADGERAVLATVLGLLQRGKRVKVVTDAIGVRDEGEAKMAFRKIKAKGAKLVETRQIAGRSHLKGTGICKCRACRAKRGKNAARKAEPQHATA